ncbi:hypothetical protein VP01_2925g2 [Puccinia sorghi]|uniref:Uncharacterized protein n=1 Tax=Puccinia sorghi TaxID=27349 RepID=A0A0L6V2Z1_9BASI|nr:hypothetical protein VP01_2925g2 [Puccinia sorghi]
MSSNPHSQHPLYAFLQTDQRRLQQQENPSANGDEPISPPAGGKMGADRAFNKHLMSLLTTVQGHSSQLDQMVNHVNSLVKRVESVEAIFSEGQEQVHQLVVDFKADTAKIALQTADRINLTLQPTLSLVTDSLAAVNGRLEAMCSQVEQQRIIQHSQGLLLAKLEKESQSLALKAQSLDARLDSMKTEDLQRLENLQKEYTMLSSNLAPITHMTPLLRAFLESQLRSPSVCKKPFDDSLGWQNDPYSQAPILKGTVTRHSSALSVGRLKQGNNADNKSMERPDTAASVSNLTTKRPESDPPGNIGDNRPARGNSDNHEVSPNARAEPEEASTVGNRETEDVLSKAEAEHELTITQASGICSQEETCRQQLDQPDDQMDETIRVLGSQVGKRRSLSRRMSQVRPTGSTQEESCSMHGAVRHQRSHARKRTRSRTPTGVRHLVRSESISTTQLRTISFQPTTIHDAAPGASFLSQDFRHESRKLSDRVIHEQNLTNSSRHTLHIFFWKEALKQIEIKFNVQEAEISYWIKSSIMAILMQFFLLGN